MVSLQDVVKAIEAGGDTMTLVLEAPPHDAQEKGGVDDDLEAYRVPQLDDGASRDVYAVARAAPQAEYVTSFVEHIMVDFSFHCFL